MDRLEAFRVLASADRQLLLHELVERDEPVSIGELSRQVAARRHLLSADRICDSTAERARVRLVHGPLPQLEEKGIVDVDWEDDEVSLTSNHEVDQLFAAAEELEQWPPHDLLERPPR